MARICALTLLLLPIGCADSTSAPTANDPGNSEAVATSETLVISVPGMDWPFSWGPRVQKALEALPGVAKATPDTDREEVTCVVDPSKFDAEQAVATLEKIDFPGSKLIDPKDGNGK